MRKILIILMLMFAVPLLISYTENKDFLATAVDVNASITKVNGTDFTSAEIRLGHVTQGALTVIFTRAAGSDATVDFAFEASYDGGTTWATFEGATILVATNHPVISGTTVRVLRLVNTVGVSHLRLKSITNNDSGNNLTACNVTLSI